MKKILLMTIVFAAAVACLMMGVTSLIANATSVNVHHANRNYLFLPAPRMLAADANNVYVINGDRQLLAISTATTGPLNVRENNTLDFTPVFIKHAGNRVFLFRLNGFTTILTNNINGTPSGADLGGTYNFFDVVSTGTNSFRVFFASSTHFGWNDYIVSGTTWERTASTSLPAQRVFAVGRNIQIKSLSADGHNTVFICTAELIWDDMPIEYSIFQINIADNEPVHSSPVQVIAHDLYGFTEHMGHMSFSAVAGKGQFVYINHNREVTLFDRNNAGIQPYAVQRDRYPSLWRTGESRNPVFATSFGTQYVYVIDTSSGDIAGKHSIDRYTITPDARLEFDAVIAAHRGGDKDFFNSPMSLTLLSTAARQTASGASQYLVTDRSGQIVYNTINADGTTTTAPFFADAGLRLSSNARATYDNFNTVYIYDFDEVMQRNRVRTFTLTQDGRPTTHTNEFTHRDFDNANVTRLFAGADRTVYALDTTNGRIVDVRAPGTLVRDLPTPFNTTLRTTATYSDHLDAFIIARGSTDVRILPLPPVGGQTTLTFDQNIIDITTDTLGNLITLSSNSSGRFFVSQYLRVGDTFDLSHEDNWRHELKCSAPACASAACTHVSVNLNNPSLSLDRMNGRLLWLGARHAIESFNIPADDIWLPSKHTHNTSWKTAPLTALNKTSTIFAQATADTIIYQYPNGTHGLALAREGSIFKVLHVLDASTYFVLFENPASTSPSILGYVSRRSVNDGNEDAFYTTPSFINARTVFEVNTVYKFPTTGFGQELALRDLPKNFEQNPNQTGGLILRNRVIARDKYGRIFYEILLRKNDDGTYTPDTNGQYVGYIHANNVINYHGLAIPRFTTNATVRVTASTAQVVQVYERNNAGVFEPIRGAVLSNRQAIRVEGPSVGGFTPISYRDPELGPTATPIDGWIRDEFVVMNGLSTVQLIAIVSLALLVLGGGATFVIIRSRKKRG